MNGQRAEEELDVQSLQQYVRQVIAELPDESLVIRQFSAGHSNLTYELTCGHWSAVLRRPPLGPIAPKAHDMRREFHFLKALHPIFPKAPTPYVYCDDESVLGSPFFIMEKRQGVLVDREFPDAYRQSYETCLQMSHAIVDTLVELHQLELSLDLRTMGKPEGYMARQVSGWVSRYERSKTSDLPLAQRVAQWLMDHVPNQSDLSIVHNDFKLNNLLLAPKKPSVVTAVLDWEMATLGDPLADLAITLSYWAEPDDSDVLKRGASVITTLAGFLTREEVMHRYSMKTGRNLGSMNFYMTFAYFKVAVIVQQIYFRWKCGQTTDTRFAQFDKVVSGLLEEARKQASL